MSNTPTIPSVPWYLSRTVWMSITAAVFNIANQVGIHVDPYWTNTLPDILLNVAWLVTAAYAGYCHLRFKKSVTPAVVPATLPANLDVPSTPAKESAP